jgi:hypothetical protein
MDVVDGAMADIAEMEQILEDAVLSGLALTKFVPALADHLLARLAAVFSACSQGIRVKSVIQKWPAISGR